MTKRTVTNIVFQVTNLQQVAVLDKKLFQSIGNTTLREKLVKDMDRRFTNK